MCYLLSFISYHVIYITSHITFLLLYVSPGHLNVVYPAAKFASKSFFFFTLLVIVRSPQSYTVSRKVLPYPIASRLPGRIKARQVHKTLYKTRLLRHSPYPQLHTVYKKYRVWGLHRRLCLLTHLFPPSCFLGVSSRTTCSTCSLLIASNNIIFTMASFASYNFFYAVSMDQLDHLWNPRQI